MDLLERARILLLPRKMVFPGELPEDKPEQKGLEKPCSFTSPYHPVVAKPTPALGDGGVTDSRELSGSSPHLESEPSLGVLLPAFIPHA